MAYAIPTRFPLHAFDLRELTIGTQHSHVVWFSVAGVVALLNAALVSYVLFRRRQLLKQTDIEMNEFHITGLERELRANAANRNNKYSFPHPRPFVSASSLFLPIRDPFTDSSEVLYDIDLEH